ncbi:MAG TPA: hypothetical protein VFA12_10185 [Stellaceae bacterium]|nr:hypothetical protein [Stellaceae bacterium]
MKVILGAVLAAMVVGAGFAQPAEAACWSNGWRTECWHHPHWWRWHHPYWHHWHHGW